MQNASSANCAFWKLSVDSFANSQETKQYRGLDDRELSKLKLLMLYVRFGTTVWSVIVCKQSVADNDDVFGSLLSEFKTVHHK